MTVPRLNVRPATATRSDASQTARGTARASAGGWLALPVLMTGTFLIVLDFFIVNVTIPSLQAGLRASTGAIEWVVAGYGLTFAVFLVSAGRLGDRVGRRRAFSIGLALFVLASASCGLAPSVSALVGARLAQGLGAASWAGRAWTWASLIAAPVLLGALGAHQRWLAGRGGSPLLDSALFAIGTLRAGLVTQLSFWCGQAALFLVLALYLQDGRGLDPLRAGPVFTILATAYLVASPRAPSLTLRLGRDLIGVGALVLAAGDGALLAAVAHEGAGGPVGLLAPGLALVGAGQGQCITPLTATALSHTDPQRAGAVSGALSTMHQVGNALGVAVPGLIFFRALGGGYASAFERGLLHLACLAIAVAALTRLLPRAAASAGGRQHALASAAREPRR